MIKKSNIESLFIFLIVNCLIFQSYIQETVFIFKYFDEIITILSFVYLIFTLKNYKIKKFELDIFLGIIVLIFIGFIGTMIYQYQSKFSAIFTDIFNLFKFFVCILGLNRFFKNKNVNFLKIQLKFQKPIIILTFIFMLVNFFVGIDEMTYEIRYGLRAFQFIYGHAGALNVITTFQICFILYDLIKNKNSKKNILYFLLCEIILISTLRSRAFVFAAVAFILYFYFVRENSVRKNSKVYIILGLIVVLLITKAQIDTYFNSQNRTPRSDLLNGSIVLMKECFPIGSGFATYGSYAASKYYSQLYYRFGFNNYFGMSDSDSQFLTDNFWPIIVGEFGVIGIFIYVYILYKLFKFLWNFCNKNEKKAIFFLILFTMLFNSTVSSAFVHYTAITYSMILTYLINDKEGEKYNE